jgi:hypothetical protein
MNTEMTKYVRQIHNETYNLFGNNCIHKSLKILKKARELGVHAELVVCFASAPGIRGLIPLVGLVPHVFILLNGQKVDVALSPEQEEKYCKNSDLKILLPMKLTRQKEGYQINKESEL